MFDPEHVARFTRAMFDFMRNDSFRFLPKPMIEARLEICKQCDNFEPLKKACKVCGCGCDNGVSIFNKLALPSEECPLHPPKWHKVAQAEIKPAMNARALEERLIIDPEKCPMCRGSGLVKINQHDSGQCPKCGGTGLP